MARTNKDMSPRLRDNNRDRLFTKAKVVLGSVATAATAAGSAASAYALTVINKSVGTIEGVWRTTDAYAKIKDVSGTAIESSLETINNVLPLQTIPTSMLAVAAVASAVWTASQGYKHHELTREHQLLMPLPPLTAPAHANIGN